MSLTMINSSSIKAGTCPHGLPQGACPICSGMSGGMKKADFSAKPGEMSWNECAAIGAFLKAQQNAKIQREQDAQNFAQRAIAFQNVLINASQKLANLAQFFAKNTPAIISKPIGFVLNTVIGGMVRTVANIPAAISNTFQVVQQKITDISDKLTAIMGEYKASIEKRISDVFSSLKKKVKSLFSIFQPLDTDNNEKKVDETKKTFHLKTFIHNLYRKIIKEDEE